MLNALLNFAIPIALAGLLLGGGLGLWLLIEAVGPYLIRKLGEWIWGDL